MYKSFNPDAQVLFTFSTRDGAPPIDLVDGEELARKLKELGLGVKTEMIEQVSVDPAWFQGL